jgi:hypothetical protein
VHRNHTGGGGKTDREAVHWDSGGAEGVWYQITIQDPGYKIAEPIYI